MKIDVSHSFFEQSVIFIASLSFCFSIAFLINDYSSIKILHDFIFILPSLFIFSLINFLMLRIFNSEKAGILTYIRYFIISSIFLITCGFLIFKLFGSAISGFFIFPLSFIGYWYMSNLYKVFFSHEIFLQQCENKKGAALAEELYHNNINALEFAQKIKSIKISLIFIVLALVFLLIGIDQCNFPVSFFTWTAIIIHICSVCILFILFSIYNRESFYAFLGQEQIFHLKNSIFKYSLIVCLISSLFAFIISSNKSLLNFSAFLNFIKRLLLKKSGINNIAEPQQIIPEQHDQYESLPELQFSAAETQPLPYIDVFYAVLKYVLIVSLILFFFYFMIKPFTGDSWKNFWKEGKLKKLFMNFKNTIKQIFRDFFHGKKVSVNYSKTEYKSFMDSLSDFIKNSKKSKEKRLELDRLSKLFVKLIECGEKNGIEYRKNLAPFEYVSLLNNENALNAGILFEKALYAKDLLTKKEEFDFKSNIEAYINHSEIK